MREGRGPALTSLLLLGLPLLALHFTPSDCRRNAHFAAAPLSATAAAPAPAAIPAKSEAAEEPAWDGPAPPVDSIKDIELFTDDQLYSIFSNGTAAIPGSETKDKYQFCKGRPLINSWTKGGYPTGTWPQGTESPLNNVYSKGWFGKVMVTNSTDNKTHVWNVVFSNHTVEFSTLAYIEDPSMDKDGKPSMVINYNTTEDVWARVFKDEIRKVGPHIWVGRVYIVNPVEALRLTPSTPIEKAVFQLSEHYVNATVMNAFTALGIEGPDSQPVKRASGIPYPILYFALDCQDSQVPALHYTALSKIEEAMAAVLRYADWGYELPTLNHTVADENAVDKPVAIGESDGSYPELRGYGMKLSELGQIGTIPTLPHLPFEPSILEAPMNVIEGRRTPNIFGPANETVTQTPVQSMLDSAYHTVRSAVIEDVGKPVTSVVMHRVTEVTDALAQPQKQAAQLSAVLVRSGNALANQTGIASLENAISLGMAPAVAQGERDSMEMQRTFTQFNHFVNQNREQVLATVSRGLAPLAGVATAIEGSVQQAVRTATSTAASAQYNFDANNAALLAPVAEFTSTALLRPAAAMTRAAISPYANAALAGADAIAGNGLRNAGSLAASAMSPLRAGIQGAINLPPLSAALGPVASALPTPQSGLVTGPNGIVRQIAETIGGPRRNLLQLASALLPDPEDDDAPELPLPRVRLVDDLESGSGDEAAPASRTVPRPRAVRLPFMMASEDSSAQTTDDESASGVAPKMMFARKGASKSSGDERRSPLDALAMAMATDPLQPMAKSFQELTGQILDTPEGAEDPDTIAHLPSRVLPSMSRDVHVVPAMGSAAEALPASKPAEAKPAQQESADSSDDDPVDEAMSSGPIHFHDADEDAAQTEPAKPASTSEDSGAVASAEADKEPSVEAKQSPASPAKASPASSSSSSGLSGLLNNLFPEINFDSGPRKPSSASSSQATPKSGTAASKGSSVQPLAGLPGPHPSSSSTTLSLDDLFSGNLFDGPSRSSSSTAAAAATQDSTAAPAAQKKQSAPAPSQKASAGGASNIAATKPAGKGPAATSALPTAATGAAGVLPSTMPTVTKSQEPLVSPELQAIEQIEEQALGPNTPAAAKTPTAAATPAAVVPAAKGEVPTATSRLPAAATSGAAAAVTQGAASVSPAAVPVQAEPHVSSELQEIEGEQKEELREAVVAASKAAAPKVTTAANPLPAASTAAKPEVPTATDKLPASTPEVPTATSTLPANTVPKIPTATSALPTAATSGASGAMPSAKISPELQAIKEQVAPLTSQPAQEPKKDAVAQPQEVVYMLGGIPLRPLTFPAPSTAPQLATSTQGPKPDLDDKPYPVVPARESAAAAAQAAAHPVLTKEMVEARLKTLAAGEKPVAAVSPVPAPVAAVMPAQPAVAPMKTAPVSPAMAPAGQAAAKGPSFADIANELEQQMGVQQSILSKLAASRKVDHAAQAPTAAAPMAQATPLQRLMGPSATIAQGPSAQSSALTASTAGAPSTAPNAPMKPALESVVPALTSSFSRAQALQQQYAEEAGLPKAHGLATAPAAMPTGTAATAAVAQQPHPASAAGVQGAPVATRAPMGPGLQAAVPAIEKSLSRAEAMQQSYEAEVVKAVAPNPSKALPAADAPAYMHVAAMSPAGGAALFQADAMQKFYERSVLGSGQNRMAAGTMDASSSQDEVAPASAVLSATQPHAMRLTAPALSPSVAAEVQAEMASLDKEVERDEMAADAYAREADEALAAQTALRDGTEEAASMEGRE